MPNHSKNSHIFKAALIVIIFSIFTRGISFAFKIYFSRVLGAESIGLYQICLSVFYLFASFTSGGLVTVLSRRVAENRALNPQDKGLSILTSSLLVGILSSALLLLLLFLLREHIDFLFSDVRAKPLFLIMAPALITTSVYGIIRGWFWGNKDFLTFSITELLEEVFRVIFSILFVSGIVSGIYGERGIALAFVLSDIMVAFILVIMFLFKEGKLKKPTKFGTLLKPAIPLTGMRIFGGLLGTLIAILLPLRLIAGGFSVSQATASFGRVAGMANPLLFAPNAIIGSLAIVLIPEMSASGIKNNNPTLAKHIESGISLSLIISGFFLIMFATFGEDLTLFLFNDRPSGEYLRVASWLLLITPIQLITSSALSSIGLETESFKSYFISSLFMIASIYFIAPIIGFYSVVIANFLSILVNSSINLYYLNKRIGLPFSFLKLLAFLTISSSLCIFLGKTMRSILYQTSPALALIISVIMVLIIYVVTLLLSDLIKFEWFLKFKSIFKSSTHQNRT
ncbi:MAG: oligosaccharide flippase family protein [Christensenellaceae bacterium]|jgi:stage V sporulation protein B|nr:oligosaccharide flippase family protein [Christensenellaceae bacterium]